MLPLPGGMEVGIQTAQLLLDDRRKSQLRKQLKTHYPLVPDAVLESCIDVTAQAFTRVAPTKLQIALQPGGMEQVRPELEQVIVDFTLSQLSGLPKIPILDSADKRRLVEYMVHMALDHVLKDAQEVLSSPEVRLEALEVKMREVKAMMGPWRLFWYRVRHNTKEIAIAGFLSIAAVVLYQERNLPLIAKAFATTSLVWTKFSAILSIVVRSPISAFTVLSQNSIVVFTLLKKMVLQQ